MESTEREISTSKGRFKILLTFIVAIAGLFVLIQTLAISMTSGTTPTYAQGPVITPTLTTEEKIQEYIEAHTIQGDVMPEATPEASEAVEEPQGVADLDVAWSGNTSMVGNPGTTVTYMLTLSNVGSEDDTYDITEASGWAISLSGTSFPVTGGSSTPVSVTITVPPAAMISDSDTAVITATSQTDGMVSAVITLTTTAGSEVLYMPIMFKALLAPTLSATRPNSANDWQMNWTDSNMNKTGFELQQSTDSTFASNVTTYNLASNVSSQLINNIEPSASNVYYYRLRTLGDGQSSPWSQVVAVAGAYYDEFTSNQTGWSGPNTLKEGMRRLTYIEKVDAWYENSDWLIIRVEDSWDWAIASPMLPAPEPPYVIEFRSKPANLGNLVSHGFVFGGDWTGAPCPDWSTILGVYAHKNCFNHFYNSNLIWSSDTDLTLLWERVDNLVYCPSCGGSPLKRLGDASIVLPFHPNASDWNRYRIEVRESDIKFFMNGDLRLTYNDTRWIDDPYFGVFASTDEYSNSTWRFDYIRITPLDN
ncbi:MAG: hypothetical protein CL608_04920 [Anaerolineaceae bacterium]|nr:hypothetical protein [Anaerolineaceae bacterium]